jgi:hypothetical protein
MCWGSLVEPKSHGRNLHVVERQTWMYYPVGDPTGGTVRTELSSHTEYLLRVGNTRGELC